MKFLPFIYENYVQLFFRQQFFHCFYDGFNICLYNNNKNFYSLNIILFCSYCIVYLLCVHYSEGKYTPQCPFGLTLDILIGMIQ